ncbi:hypothetical protein [Natronorubrum sp. FCH18a]|uniref:hypothetical protein n=1 Tax=Natronorubrum sp. FCH18a TaxID=3447018 RepID=UPI003F5173DC
MRRALLTDGERAAIRGDESVDDDTRSTHRSRVKQKLERRMRDDARLLREHDPELFDILQTEVCEESLVERVDRLERELEDVKEQLDDSE